MVRDTEGCFVCGENNPVVLQRHHIVPRRYDGDDSDENLVMLCANCHVALERIYTNEVFAQLGRAWRVQQPDVVSDILVILESSDPENYLPPKNSVDTFRQAGLGPRIAEAYHHLGEDGLKQVLATLCTEARESVGDGDDPAEEIEVCRRESSDAVLLEKL